MSLFYSEGDLYSTAKNQTALKSITTLTEAMKNKQILEARAVVCTGEHDLIVDFGFTKGVIPRNECAMGISDGSTRDIAIISRVNKAVCFIVTDIKQNEDGTFTPYLSRKQAQEICMNDYVNTLTSGDVIPCKVTHLETFGAFVDIGAGIISLLPIDQISISRISNPADRFSVGDNILAIVKSCDKLGRISLTHKELLGTWIENANLFKVGETVSGIVRSVENYGIFIELMPNLAGLAEPVDGVKVGQQASVYIKSIVPDKMKIKLVLVDAFDADYQKEKIKYFVDEPHIDYWKYSPDDASKIIETIF